MPGIDESLTFYPLRIAVLTVSDTRTEDTDTSGALLAERLVAAGHELAGRAIVADDVEAIRARILAWVADDRIGIIGGSYGGYMVAAALAFEPEVFDAGVNIFGVTNWVRTLESIPPYWAAFRESLYDEMGDPETDATRHRAISPLFHAKNIVKPMLVVQGANDPRVLQVESAESVAGVKANTVPVD